MAKINRYWIRFLNNFVEKPFFNTIFLILLVSAIIYLVHSILTNSINSLITGYFLIFIVVILFYEINQWISILLLGVYPLVIGITFWRLTNETQYLSIGITGVLVVITVGYRKICTNK